MSNQKKWKVTDHELILAFYPGSSTSKRRFNAIWKRKGNAGYGSEYFGADNIAQARFYAREYVARFKPDAYPSTVKVLDVTFE